MKRFLILMMILGSFILWLPAGAADDDAEYESNRGLTEKWNISVGGWVKSFDTRTRLDSEELGAGTDIDWEDDFLLERDRTDIRLEGFYRFNRTHRLEFGYTVWSRNSTAIIDDAIQYGNQLYDVDAIVKATVDTQLIKLAYKYSFIKNGKIDAGLSFGLSTFMVEGELAGQGQVDPGGPPVSGSAEVTSEDVIAPVPMLGAHLEATIKPRLFFRFSGEFFSAKIDTIDARVLDLRASVDWYPFEHVGFGAGYNLINTTVIETADPVFDLDWEFNGAIAYASFVF
jgi:hypothetical protein